MVRISPRSNWVEPRRAKPSVIYTLYRDGAQIAEVDAAWRIHETLTKHGYSWADAKIIATQAQRELVGAGPGSSFWHGPLQIRKFEI